jgi:hypothetical protein
MRNKFFSIIPLIMLVMGCAGGAKAAANSPGMDLDVAIREAAAQMGENLPGGTKIALVSVASSSAQFSEYVISRLEAALVNGKKLVVVDRANLDKVREDQGFQLSGEVDDESAKSIGKLLGAGAIVTGAFTDLGDVYGLTLKAINIETATVAVSYPADVAKSTRIGTLLASGGGAGTGTRTAQTGGSAPPVTQTAASAPTPPAPTYKIGDTGPAGGIIFYDKRNNSGGWRYLEAAPAETERTAPMSNFGRDMYGDRKVGDGKENTNKFIIYFNRHGGGINTAPWLCDDLMVNGFDDWYLPSPDELLYMYNNLYSQGLGDLKSAVYWSSWIGRIWPSAADQVSVVDLSNGSETLWWQSQIGNARYQVRAIRRF